MCAHLTVWFAGCSFISPVCTVCNNVLTMYAYIVCGVRGFHAKPTLGASRTNAPPSCVETTYNCTRAACKFHNVHNTRSDKMPKPCRKTCEAPSESMQKLLELVMPMWLRFKSNTETRKMRVSNTAYVLYFTLCMQQMRST